MAEWFLHTLGGAVLTRVDGEVDSVRFRYRDSWALLVSLATDPATTRRDALVERFGLDRGSRTGETGRDKLRIRLSDLRTGARGQGGLGGDALVTDVDTVRLRPGRVTTDLEHIRELLGRASSHPSESEARLREAASLLRGGFLEGVDPTGDGWLESMRAEAEGLSARVWLSLAQALRSGPDRRAAFDAARRAFSLRPEDPDALELLLELSDGAREHKEVLRLSGKTDGPAHDVTEATALEVAVRTRLEQISTPVRAGLLALSVFPDGFTPEQAERVCEVSPALLERIGRAFPMVRDGDRHRLHTPIRSALWALNRPDERARLQQSHADHFCHWLMDGAYRRIAGWEERIRRDEAHLHVALEWVTRRPPTLEAYQFLAEGFRLAVQGILSPGFIEAIQARREWLLEGARTLEGRWGLWCHAQLAWLDARQGDFRRAIDHMGQALPVLAQGHHDMWVQMLAYTHHAVRDDLFDEVADLLTRDAPDPDPYLFQGVRFLLAENRLARDRAAEALDHNTRAFAAVDPPLSEEAPRYARREVVLAQRARILSRMGRGEEADAIWDDALIGYEAAGMAFEIAECHLALGMSQLRRGRPGLAESLVHGALRAFEDLEKAPAAAAAKGRLAELLWEVGRRDEALALAREALAFWREEGNPRWVRSLEDLVARLSADGSG